MQNYKELLVVLGCLCVSALLLTAMSPRDQALALTCQNHLRSLRDAAALYEKEHDGNIVPVKTTLNKKYQTWAGILLPYVSDVSIYYCPADLPHGSKALERVDLIPTVYRGDTISYGMNYFLGDVQKSRKPRNYNINLVDTPEKIIFFGDSQTPFLRPTQACWQLDFAPFHAKTSSCFVFVDGHTGILSGATLGIIGRPDGFENWQIDDSSWHNWKKE